MDLNRVARAARYAVIVACDVAEDVASGLSKTAIAATRTLSYAAVRDPAQRMDPRPAWPSGRFGAPSPWAPLPRRLLEDLRRVDWPDVDESPAWVPDDLAGLEKRGWFDGPEVSP